MKFNKVRRHLECGLNSVFVLAVWLFYGVEVAVYAGLIAFLPMMIRRVWVGDDEKLWHYPGVCAVVLSLPWLSDFTYVLGSKFLNDTGGYFQSSAQACTDASLNSVLCENLSEVSEDRFHLAKVADVLEDPLSAGYTSLMMALAVVLIVYFIAYVVANRYR